jgi:hypothetical protein
MHKQNNLLEVLVLLGANRQERFRELKKPQDSMNSMENQHILTDYMQVAHRDGFKLASVPERQGREM